ncbi:HEAT repeat domain-containing protein [Streptomyces sp. NPDC048248]|uniref:HEAT repeat domain-containing protein n=1 Tax=Streptomyces sp. NPDC048248 TaxID=3365523 RepID=UPI0037225802
MNDRIADLVQQIRTGDHAQRHAAEEQLTALGTPAVEYLLPLFEGAKPPHAARAARCLTEVGEPALDALRDIRRHGPGRLRRPALHALTEVGGGDALSPEDRLAVERLIRIKLIDEEKIRLPAGSWIAIPADQVPGAVRALGLHDLRPATLAMGISAAHSHHQDAVTYRVPDGAKKTAYRIFITPDIEGWRLIYGRQFLHDSNGVDIAIQLSAQCEQAHFFDIDDGNDSRVWWVAENGETRRGYSNHWHPEGVGDPLPFETGSSISWAWDEEEDPEDWEEDEEESAEEAEEEEVVLETDPHEVAMKISAHPAELRNVTLHDHGWLATTQADCPNSRFKGALSL